MLVIAVKHSIVVIAYERYRSGQQSAFQAPREPWQRFIFKPDQVWPRSSPDLSNTLSIVFGQADPVFPTRIKLVKIMIVKKRSVLDLKASIDQPLTVLQGSKPA